MTKTLTLERLKEVLWYDPSTGIFIWLISRPKIKIGAVAGNTKKSRVPYILIGIDGKQYYGHILAWFYMTGVWPTHIIDHKDTDGLNNKWENLRKATKSQNGVNSKVRSTNKLGVKGISKNRQGYLVRICLGTYNTLEEAVEVYNKAILQHFGEFANLSKLPIEVEPVQGNA